ncbi:hypothetical protein DFQ26_003567 [Actinomortierella ambigua]|nr:hypothetical protein DFQ26_003567 [Actinomortierella ambigua]
MSTALAQLSQRAKQLTNHIEGLDMPHIQRGIDQIESQSRKLAAKSTKPVDGADNKALLFLAKGGVDTTASNNLLNTINLKSIFEPLHPVYETDTEAYLKHQHEHTILNTIEESRRETVQHFDNNFETALNYDWERTKKRIFEELGHSAERADDAAAVPNLARSTVGAPQSAAGASSFLSGFGHGSATLDSILSKLRPYYRVVYNLCDARLQGAGMALLTQFNEAAQIASKEEPHPKIQESWELLSAVLGEQELRNGRFQSQILKERVYAKAYLMSPYNSLPAARLRQLLIKGSLAFLEKQYMNVIENSIAENSGDANLGGVPSIANTVRAFVHIKYVRYGNWTQPNLEVAAGGTALWAQMYYMIRSGHSKEALEFAKEQEAHFLPADRQFVTYLGAYLQSEDHTLPVQLQDRIMTDYNQRIRYAADTMDPYKLTLYKIVGRCELSKKTTPAIAALEDYIWLQLRLVRENRPETPPQDRYDLAAFQDSILKFGPAYFNPKNNNPLQYFQVLIFSQQFERAIHYLSTFRPYIVEAVHMAIALTYYGLLRIPAVHRVSDPNAFSTTKSAEDPSREIGHFNFAQLMHYVARMLADRYPTEALTYLYQICLNTDLAEARTNEEQTQLCHSYIQDLILHAKDHATLLGTTTKGGIKAPGVMEKYLKLIKIENKDQFVKQITIKAADRSLSEGRVEDAIELYSIAEEYNMVMTLLNKQMAEALSSNPGLYAQLNMTTGGGGAAAAAGGAGDAMGNNSLLATRRLAKEYMNDSQISARISDKNLETCRTLLQLVSFMEQYDRGRYEAALAVIEQLDFIPLEADMARITKKVEEFKNLDESVARSFPEILVKTMESIYRLYTELKESRYDEPGRRELMSLQKRRARTLMMFAGSIKFRMPADTYARLNRLDVFIAA